jgi:hypothetical protein
MCSSSKYFRATTGQSGECKVSSTLHLGTLMPTNKLPNLCFICIPERDPGDYIVAIRLGQSGCYATTYDTKNLADAQRLVAQINERLGITPQQVEYMRVGSMFGWDVPGANPDHKAPKQSSFLRPIPVSSES